jgi:hypothetical protein
VAITVGLGAGDCNEYQPLPADLHRQFSFFFDLQTSFLKRLINNQS